MRPLTIAGCIDHKNVFLKLVFKTQLAYHVSFFQASQAYYAQP